MGLPVEVLEAISAADVVVFEGFEMTGKSYLAKQINQDYDSILYRPDWEGSMTDKVVSRGNRYIPGLAALGLWKQFHPYLLEHGQSPKLLIDRCMAVSYVYQILYNQQSDAMSLDDLVQAHHSAAEGLNVIIIHKQHEDEHEARRMYEISSGSADHSDIYDRFDDFDTYYRSYLKFNDTYLDFYQNHCHFPTYLVSSLGNKLLDRRNVE